MIIENNPSPLSQKEQFIASKVVIRNNRTTYPEGVQFHSFFGEGWNGNGLELVMEYSTYRIYTWHRWPRNGLDSFPSEVPTREIAETVIKRELVNRFIRDAQNLLRKLYSDSLEGELPLLCPIPIPEEAGHQAWAQATDFAIYLLEGNTLEALKEFI